MVVLRNADGSSRWWPLVLWCALACTLVTAASAYEASGQGESTYEEYDDEGPYHRPFELPDSPDDDGLEDFDDHGPVDGVLDPITDDDISYSGYYDEDGLDRPSASPVHEGNVSSVGPETRVSVSDDQHLTQDLSTIVGVQKSATSVTETSVNPLAQTLSAVRVDAGVNLTTGFGGNATTLAGAETAQTTTAAAVNVTSCAGHQKLAEQPVYIGPSVNFIRKCCPHGQRLVYERSILVSCRKESEIVEDSETFPAVRDDSHNGTTMSGIVAKFYDGCIEDLEEDVLLGFSFGNPCASERGLVSFGARTNDTLYVIQNGSLLVIYGVDEDYDIFDTYCLDYDSDDGSLLGYVCPMEVQVQTDIIGGMLFILNICLVFAIPLLLVTAALYMTIPDLHDLHGRALAMNSVNFAIALLLESFFQHKTRGNRLNGDEMVLENYAEYFILATFFWLLVNCANNCFYAWIHTPKSRDINKRWENRRFIGYAIVAQLMPLWIILSFSTTPEGNPAIKHYFFGTIITVLVVTVICQIICCAGLRRLKTKIRFYHVLRYRLQKSGQMHEITNATYIPAKKANKVIYMTNYTTLLFGVMAAIWTVMTVTYYSTYELPIFYDILFGLQGILMFIIFVCMPRPWRTVLRWLQQKQYCGMTNSENTQSQNNGDHAECPESTQEKLMEHHRNNEQPEHNPPQTNEASARRSHIPIAEQLEEHHGSSVQPEHNLSQTNEASARRSLPVDEAPFKKININNPFSYLPECV